jgi:polyhydroxyalkanoate synthesis regulator phasin
MLGDDASVLAAAIAAGGSGAPSTPLVSQTVQQAMSQGTLWTKEDCSGIVTGKSTASLVLSSAGAAAIKFAGATGPAAPFVLIAGGVMQVFGAIFGHHAAKVQQEQKIICAVVQSVNDSLSVIDQAVQQGAITADQARASLDQLYSDLQKNVQPILKQDSSHCNAACFILAEARGVIGKRKEMYVALQPAASLKCAQAYWALYPDVAASPDFGPKGGPAGAFTHYSTWGQNEGRTWPCDAQGNLLSSAGSSGTNPLDQAAAAAGSLVEQLARSFNAPTWAVWLVGGLVGAKLLKVF